MDKAKRSNLMPLDLNWKKSDQRVLLSSLEKYYCSLLFKYQIHKDLVLKDTNKTRTEKVERNWRLKLKAIETVLKELGSEFTVNAVTNHRKTTEVEALKNGALQDKAHTWSYIRGEQLPE